MNIYAIGDLHLSGNPPTKPMNIFGPHWDNHWQRIKEHWLSTVTDEEFLAISQRRSTWVIKFHKRAMMNELRKFYRILHPILN